MSRIDQLNTELATLKANADKVAHCQDVLAVARQQRKAAGELFELAVSLEDFSEADKAAEELKTAKVAVDAAKGELQLALAKPHSAGRIADVERKLEAARRAQGPLTSTPFAGLNWALAGRLSEAAAAK